MKDACEGTSTTTEKPDTDVNSVSFLSTHTDFTHSDHLVNHTTAGNTNSAHVC